MLFAVSPASGRLPALRSRCLAVAVLAAWGWNACAQTGLDPAAADVPATPTAAQRAATPPEADPLAALISNEQSAAAPIAGELAGDAPVAAIAQDTPKAAAADGASPATSTATPPTLPEPPPPATWANAGLDDNGIELAGPPDPPLPPEPVVAPPPPVVLFPKRLGEFVADAMPKTATPAEGEDADTPALAGESYALVSQLPADDPAGEQVWRLGYSGRAAYDDRTTATRACAGGGTLSTGIGGGLACRSTGEVKVKESLFSLDGGAQVQLVAQAKGTDATSINGRPAAVDPYALLPQIYTSVTGLSVLDGATMWAGRRESSSFLMSSGLLPPTSPAMRFGVDNARFGDIALNYQYTARNDLNGANLPSYHSLRTAPIATNEKGSVQLGYTRVEAQPLIQQTGSAWWVSAMHEQQGVLAGTNRFGMQFGEGSRNALTGYTGMGPALSRVRVAESMEWKQRSGLGLAGSVESSMQFDRSPVGTLQWMATRVRPAYIASDQFKLTFEVAHDQISSGFGASGQRTAVTVAPTFTLGKAAGNANLRAFYTYSKASDVDGIAFASPADTWASQTSGSIFGVQLNRRW
ncbi:carbohydrate porin [Cupriavidus basilensis]|uniref:carbohydrate porin n=1 Tax=Cupriavidus basilensis TaxID=68895 RepID=UPI0028412E5E|nr:carbohydrate porin [Cupriavidus basilensis]MDR3379265.1 carbohydrate porin [Cupriavidus basilensis]